MKKYLLLSTAMAIFYAAPSYGQSATTPTVITGTDSTGFPITSPIGTGSNGSVPMPISGTISASNPSVGTNAATAPTSSTQIGSVVGGNLQPVSSLNPLPVSGSFTPSGTQNVTGTGTAGTPATGVVTIQGISGGTVVPVSQATADNLNATVVGTGTFSVQNTAATPAGSAIIGKIGIDQTTPGTTNGVQVLTGSTTTVTQGTAANLNATVVGTGTFAVQSTQAASSSVGITTQSCSTACASTLLSGAHAAYGISASSTVTGWILVYDATTCSANGTVTPKKAYAYTVANSTIAISWGNLPMVNSTGIAVCFSTSGPYTATSSATAFLSLDYK